MDTLVRLFQGAIMGAIIGSIMMAFVVCLKYGYDHFDAVHSLIDTIGHLMLTNPFA